MNSYYKKIMITFVALVLGTNSLWAKQMEKCVVKEQRFERVPNLLFGGYVERPYCHVFCPSVGDLDLRGNCQEIWYCVGQYEVGQPGQAFMKSSFQKFHGKCPTKKQFDKFIADKEKKQKAEEAKSLEKMIAEIEKRQAEEEKRQAEEEKKRKKEEAERKRRDKKNQEEAERKYNKYNKLCSVEGNGSRGTMIDSRDGTEYATVQICSQVWMAENLNYNTGNSYCYDTEFANCEKYGRLYTWDAALNACPSGWHLPTAEEFATLISNVGGEEGAAIMLKSKTGWAGDGNGLDKYGFNVLPAGLHASYGSFIDAGESAGFWSATESGEDDAYALSLDYKREDAYLDDNNKDIGAHSVRCIQDEKKNVGDGLAGLLSGNANDNDQKESADFNEGDATESSSHDACKAAVAKAKNTFNRCKTFPKESSERSLCAKKYKKEKENAEKACIIKNAKNSCSRSASDIMKVVRQRTPGLRHIYNKFLKQQPHFQGVVSLRFTIAPGGEIISISIASSTTGYGEFDNEIKTAVSRWNFGKFKCDDGNVANETTVTIPFTFSE